MPDPVEEDDVAQADLYFLGFRPPSNSASSSRLTSSRRSQLGSSIRSASRLDPEQLNWAVVPKAAWNSLPIVSGRPAPSSEWR